MEINKENLIKFRKEFTEAMLPLQEKYGVVISLGSINYEEERFSAKITVINGVDKDEVARNSFDADVWRYEHIGLKTGMYNRIFIGEDGQKYAFRGFNTKAKKWSLTLSPSPKEVNKVEWCRT